MIVRKSKERNEEQIELNKNLKRIKKIEIKKGEQRNKKSKERKKEKFYPSHELEIN